MDWKPGAFVLARFNLSPGIDIAADAVFRSIKRNQIDLRGLEKYIHGAAELAVDTTWIGDQPDPFSFQSGESAVPEDLDTGFDITCKSRKSHQHKCRRADKLMNKVAKQHIITRIKNPT